MPAQESLTLRAGFVDTFQRGNSFVQRGKDGRYRATFRGPFRGLDTTSNLTAVTPDYLIRADNTDILENGAAAKRKGYLTVLTSDWGSRNIRQGYEFKFSTAGTNQILVYGHTAAGSSGILGKFDGLGGVSSVKSSLSETARPSMFQFKDLFFYYNGVDDFLYDGTNTRQIGITPPAGAPSLASNTNGSLTPTAQYGYAYTYYNSVTGAESSPSPVAFVTIAADPNDGVTATVVAGDSSTADTIRLYRTVANGVVLFLDTTDVISSTSILSTQGDAGLGKQLEEDNTRPSVYGLFPYGWVTNSRVYLTGRLANVNRVQASAYYSEGPHPESFPATHFCDAESSKGRRDANVGGGSAGEWPIVLKKESVGRIEQVGANDPTRSDDPVIFQYKELSSATTAVSHFAQCNVLGELIWLGKDNIYATDGLQVRPLANKISSTIKTLDFSDTNELTGYNDATNKRVWFTVKSDSSQTEPNWILVGSYYDYPNFYWTIYKNIKFGCIFDVPSLGHTYAGNVELNGKVFRINHTDSDNGSAITWLLRTPPISFGMEEEEKLFQKDIIFAAGDGSNYSFIVNSIYDLTDATEEPMSLSLSGGGSQWSSFVWGAEVWANPLNLSLEYHSHRKAFYKQLQFENSAADEPIVIYGFTLSAFPKQYR